MKTPTAERRSFAASTAALSDIRAHVGERVVALGFGGRRDDIVLVVSELATNAMTAANAAAASHRVPEIEIVTRSDGEMFELVVTNRATDAPSVSTRPLGDIAATATSGRGLPIVAALSQVMVVEHHDDIVTVSARFHR